MRSYWYSDEPFDVGTLVVQPVVAGVAVAVEKLEHGALLSIVASSELPAIGMVLNCWEGTEEGQGAYKLDVIGTYSPRRSYRREDRDSCVYMVELEHHKTKEDQVGSVLPVVVSVKYRFELEVGTAWCTDFMRNVCLGVTDFRRVTECEESLCPVWHERFRQGRLSDGPEIECLGCKLDPGC